MKLSRLALAIALVPAGHALAQTPDYDAALKLPETVVTASRTVQDRADTSAAVTVFTREDIDRLQPRDVTDLLERVPGLTIARNGGPGSITGVFMRGTSTSQTLVLVDGQRIAGASSGASSLEFINPDLIERIEVVRGGRSALYGSDAIGGVIQIFTRRGNGEGLQARVKVSAGSHSTWKRNLGLSGGNGQTRFDFGLSLDETDGFNRTDIPGSSHSAYRNKAASFSLSHQFTDRIQAGINLLRQSGKSEYDYTQWPATYADTEFEVSSSSVFIQAQVLDNWSSRLEFGHSEDRQKGHDPYGGSVFNSYRNQVNWLNTLQLDEYNQLIFGADWYEDTLHTSSDFNRESRWNRALFAQHQYSGDIISTELGIRHDKNQQSGSRNSWNAALTWHLNDSNDLTLSYSEAFRAPTFNDLYYPDSCFPGWGCTIYANPDLKPEKSRSYELQWRSQLASATHLEVSIYRTVIRDAIITPNALDGNQAGSFNPYRPENMDKVRINGLEVALQQELFGWQGTLGYSLVDARNAGSNANNGHRLTRRPMHKFTADVDRQFGDFNVGASWIVVNHSYDDLGNDRRISGYGTFDLRGGWQVTRDVRLDLQLENLFDRDYSQTMGTAYQSDAPFLAVPFNYREPGRTAQLSVTWTPELL